MNMAGGIKAWDSPVALGDTEQGLALFDDNLDPTNALKVAYSLEAGLRNFYLSMMNTIQNPSVKSLFDKLSAIEVKHQDRIFDEYLRLSGEAIDREVFDARIEDGALEGGLTTDEYLDLFKPDMASLTDVISLAMSIEAQALDLYTRAADTAKSMQSKSILQKIAQEERTHLEQLGQLFSDL